MRRTRPGAIGAKQQVGGGGRRLLQASAAACWQQTHSRHSALDHKTQASSTDSNNGRWRMEQPWKLSEKSFKSFAQVRRFQKPRRYLRLLLPHPPERDEDMDVLTLPRSFMRNEKGRKNGGKTFVFNRTTVWPRAIVQKKYYDCDSLARFGGKRRKQQGHGCTYTEKTLIAQLKLVRQFLRFEMRFYDGKSTKKS